MCCRTFQSDFSDDLVSLTQVVSILQLARIRGRVERHLEPRPAIQQTQMMGVAHGHFRAIAGHVRLHRKIAFIGQQPGQFRPICLLSHGGRETQSERPFDKATERSRSRSGHSGDQFLPCPPDANRPVPAAGRRAFKRSRRDQCPATSLNCVSPCKRRVRARLRRAEGSNRARVPGRPGHARLDRCTELSAVPPRGRAFPHVLLQGRATVPKSARGKDVTARNPGCPDATAIWR